MLFDLGNVLVRYDPQEYRKVFPHLGIDLLKEAVQRLRVSADQCESGRMSSEEFRRAVGSMLDRPRTQAEFDADFCAVLPGPIEGMDDIVRRVSAICETALVSNTNPIHFRHCLKVVPALRFLRRFHLSYLLGSPKPHTDFYSGAIRSEGGDPGGLVFIDDIAENVSAAREAGMQGILFTDASALERQLHPFLPGL